MSREKFRHVISVVAGLLVGFATYPILDFTFSMAHMAKRLNYFVFGKHEGSTLWLIPQILAFFTFPLIILGAGVFGAIMSPFKLLYYSAKGYELTDILLLPKANINQVKIDIDKGTMPAVKNSDQYMFNTRTVVAMIAIFAALSLLAGAMIFGMLHGAVANFTYNIMSYVLSHMKLSLVGASEATLIFGFAGLATAAATTFALAVTFLTNLMYVAGIVFSGDKLIIENYDTLANYGSNIEKPSFAYKEQEPAFYGAVISVLKAPCQGCSSTSSEGADSSPSHTL